MMNQAKIGFDLGGTNMGASIVALDGKILYSNECPTLANESAENVINRIKNLISNCFAKAKTENLEILSIGIGCPGIIDTDNGIVKYSPNLTNWSNVEISKILNQEFNVPVYVDNDVRVAALGEYFFGAGRGYKNILCITIGTGIGGGIILDGKIMRGSSQSMGEIGHITLKKDGPLCGCGNYGCLEALASSIAIIREAKAVIENNGSEIMKNLFNNTGELNAKLVTDAYHQGDKEAIRIVNEVAEWVGIGLSSVINLINPEVIIIGGGVALAGDILFNPIKKEIEKRALKIPRELVKIVPAQLGNDAGMIGSSTLGE